MDSPVAHPTSISLSVVTCNLVNRLLPRQLGRAAQRQRALLRVCVLTRETVSVCCVLCLLFYYTVWFPPRRHTGARTQRRPLRYCHLAPSPLHRRVDLISCAQTSTPATGTCRSTRASASAGSKSRPAWPTRRSCARHRSSRRWERDRASASRLTCHSANLSLSSSKTIRKRYIYSHIQ